MSAPDPETIEKMHRWFAVECNNRGWDLADQAKRSSAEERELSLAADAAAFHWSKVGTSVENARADLLRTEASVLTGRTSEAAGLAEHCVRFFEKEEGCEWDCALALLQGAFARRKGGDGEAADELLVRARTAAAKLGESDQEALAPYRDRVAG